LKKAIGYVRVSTAQQAEAGVSLDSQRDQITRYCEHNGFDLIDIYEDAGITGTKRHLRPGVQEAIRLACGQKAALVVYSLSRLARSTKDAITIFEELEAAGGDLVSITEQWNTSSPHGRMLFGLMAVLAQFERDTTSTRVKTALAHKRARGEVYGQVPYGFSRQDGNLVPDSQEQALVRQARTLRGLGESYQGIADQLNAMGLRTRRGTEWRRDRVWQVLNKRHHLRPSAPECQSSS